jgi:two-component system, NtrC family, response regulator AtoC
VGTVSRKLEGLVVDGDARDGELTVALLRGMGVGCRWAATGAEARRLLDAPRPDLVIAGMRLPDGSGLDLMRSLPASLASRSALVSQEATVPDVVGALRAGVRHLLVKPVQSDDFREAATRLVNHVRRAQARPVAVVHDRQRLGAIVGASPPMQRVYDAIRRVAPSSSTVLITGESGTGKELVARAIHAASGRAGALIAVNCGALSARLIESELFGHERGAFTGAHARHRGHFERAAGGTIFLDEIGEMPFPLQVKLLGVLENRTLLRVGGDEPITVDVRILAATNRDPRRAVELGRLRADLYYRLSGFTIPLPPLRERRGDVALIAATLLAEMNRAFGCEKQLTAAAVARLERHLWPGNVRELRNILARAFIVAGAVIDDSHLLFDSAPSRPADPPQPLNIGVSLEEVERRLILSTLAHFRGDKPRAARVLGISLKTLYNRLHIYARSTPAVADFWERRR